MNKNRTSLIKQQSCALLLAAMMFLGAGAAWGQAQAKDSLVGSWIKISKGKSPEGNLELLGDGTGKSGTTPITWKLEDGSLVIAKKVKGKETAADYGYELLNYGNRLIVGTGSSEEAAYRKKEWVEEITRVKNEAKKSVSSFTDARDKKKYKSVKINGKTWMAANLNFKADSSWCYDNKEANCTKYGRLYTWAAAKTACPAGWHLPKKEDTKYLHKIGIEDEAQFLKSNTGWPKKLNGTNDLLFSALPGGRYANGEFEGIFSKDFGNAEANWWVDLELEKGQNAQTMEIKTETIYGMGFNETTTTFIVEGEEGASQPKGYGLSVRCVQD